jgi:hypothetical protein
MAIPIAATNQMVAAVVTPRMPLVPLSQHSTSEKANPGNNLGGYPAGVTRAAGECVPDHREGGRTERNQSHGTNTRRLLFALPFNSDPSTAD